MLFWKQLFKTHLILRTQCIQINVWHQIIEIDIVLHASLYTLKETRNEFDCIMMR